jgi:hypothetical protein
MIAHAIEWVRRIGRAVLRRLRPVRLAGPEQRQTSAPSVTAVFVEDEPEHPQQALVYFVGGRDPMYAAMVCPCGCGAILRSNLRSETDPCWAWDVQDDGAVTLRPSLWRQTGCRSHFILSSGRITWCG